MSEGFKIGSNIVRKIIIPILDLITYFGFLKLFVYQCKAQIPKPSVPMNEVVRIKSERSNKIDTINVSRVSEISYEEFLRITVIPIQERGESYNP